jgi:hypothetical protein
MRLTSRASKGARNLKLWLEKKKLDDPLLAWVIGSAVGVI